MNKFLIAVVAAFNVALFAIPAAAQTTAPTYTPLDMKYSASTADTAPERIKGACPIALAPTIDARRNKDTVGSNVTMPVRRESPLLSGDAAAWTTDALANLSSFGYAVKRVPTPVGASAPVAMQPRIVRAYTWQVGMKLFGTVVLKVDYTTAAGLAETRTYRATGDKLNMVGGDGEYMTTLNYAINGLLWKIAEDLKTLCPATV